MRSKIRSTSTIPVVVVRKRCDRRLQEDCAGSNRLGAILIFHENLQNG